MRRLLVLFVLLAALFTFALPAAATPPGNPVFDTWENDDVDGSHQTMTIARRGYTVRVNYVDDGATFCEDLGFGFVPLTLRGEALLFERDPLIFGILGDAYCHPATGGRQLVVEDALAVFEYVAETDTLVGFDDGLCWYRSGNPESCAAG